MFNPQNRGGWGTTMTGFFQQARVCGDKVETTELKGKSTIYKFSCDSPQEKERSGSKKQEIGFFHQSPQRMPSLKSQRLETKQVYSSS